MGFWHTGYMEFHEPVGLGEFRFSPSPLRFPCKHCDEICSSLDELRKHRFESHPLRRPILYLQGQELSTHSVRQITRPLAADEVKTEACEKVFLNDQEISVDTLPHTLVRISPGIHRLLLSGASVTAEFTLNFCIATEGDLKGIEDEFQRTANRRRLDIRAVEEFISATAIFGSASGYRNGICAYLYGILAKERAPDSSLPYEEYVNKFNKAVEDLGEYERSLARIIRSLIEFHFNHFEEAARFANKTRIGRAAARYTAWLQNRKSEAKNNDNLNDPLNNLDALVTDWETEQIVRWAVRPLDCLARMATEVESFLNHDLHEYDKVKLHILLSEIYVTSGDVRKALQHARTLRNVPKLEGWAESMIRTHSEDRDDQL